MPETMVPSAQVAGGEKVKDKVAVTLLLDADVHEAFRQKALKSGNELETFLSSTLSIVLGCRIFNESFTCSSKLSAAVEAVSGPRKKR